MLKILLGLIFLVSFLSSSAQASDKIWINEILADPLSSQGEWVELYSSSGNFNLTDWNLKDAAGKKKILNDIEICGNFAVYQYSSDGWLNNSGKESVYLLDENDNVIDEFLDFTNPGEGKTLGRVPDGNSDWQIIDSPSKCSSSDSSQTDFSDETEFKEEVSPTPNSNLKISLSEFMPNPQDGGEWVEIKNEGANTANLIDWQIDDKEGGGGSPKKFSSQIPVGDFFVIDVGGGFLNNSGDSIRLLNDKGEEIEKFSYEESQKGSSWAKFSDGWQMTSSPTAGSGNILTVVAFEEGQESPTKNEEKTIQETKKTKKTGGKIINSEILEEKDSSFLESSSAPRIPWQIFGSDDESMIESSPGGILDSRKTKGWFFVLAGALFIFASTSIFGSKLLKSKMKFGQEEQ